MNNRKNNHNNNTPDEELTMSVNLTKTTTPVVTVTPYGAAKIVNELLKEKGIEKVLPPQMFYTYVKKGYIPSTDGKITSTDLATWVEKYITKFTTPVVETTEV